MALEPSHAQVTDIAASDAQVTDIDASDAQATDTSLRLTLQ